MDDTENQSYEKQKQSLLKLLQEWDELEIWLVGCGRNGEEQLPIQQVLDKIHTIRPF